MTSAFLRGCLHCTTDGGKGVQNTLINQTNETSNLVRFKDLEFAKFWIFYSDFGLVPRITIFSLLKKMCLVIRFLLTKYFSSAVFQYTKKMKRSLD